MKIDKNLSSARKMFHSTYGDEKILQKIKKKIISLDGNLTKYLVL